MSRLRTLLILFLCALLPLTAMSGCGRTAIGEAPTIALMPLDSRPCNTQYPALLAEAATATIALPPDNILDEFLTPADTDALWTWLEEQAETADHLIIFTNSLFCGGLIASRESGAYDQNAENLERLEALCNSFKAREDAGSITVVQVLPRLSPNQFDDALFPYYDALTDYGEAWDAADQAGEAAPEAADGVPADALAEYQRLHKESAALAKSLDALTAEGLIDQLLVSQDDGAEYCPANITFRSLADHAENTQLIYGADELSMLLVANLSAAGLDASPVRIVYSDDADRSRIYPYETASLEEMTAQKLTLGGATAGDDADATLYIHTDSSDASTTLSAVSDHDGLFALADVAQTNQADAALTAALLSRENFDAIDTYAGWNTAGNAIGTAIATLRTMDTLDARWDDLSADARKNAVRALYAFRAIRLAEDICYMAQIRPDLQQQLALADIQDHTSAFADSTAWQKANAQLQEAYTPYNTQLATLFNGAHTLRLTNHTIPVQITNFASQATFPWPRSFEVRIDVEMDVSVER